MNNHDPSVLRRILLLRQCPVFAGAELAELAVIAENATETTFATGAVVGAQQLSRRSMHLVVEGQLAGSREAHELVWGPRDVYGILESLADRSPPRAIASVPTRTLELEAADFDDILEDNFGLLSAVMKTLAVQIAGAGQDPRIARANLTPPGPGPFGLVERLIALRQLLPFATARLHPLSMLAHVASDVNWPTGTLIAREGDLAHELVILLAGRVRPTSGARVSLPPGTAIGTLETIGGFAHRATLETVEPVHALQIPGAKFLDILEDHTDLALSIVSALAGMVLDGPPHHHTN